MSGYGFTSAGTSYDFEDRLTGFARASGTFNQSWSLTSVGDWTSITTNGTTQNRTHGPAHELLTAGGSNVTTDVKGNMTAIPTTLRPAGASTALNLAWDFDNKMKSADIDANGSADVNFQYDALGRRVARTGTSGSVVFVQMDQQTIADYPVGGAASTPTYRYVYASYIDEPVVRKGAGTGGTILYLHRKQQFSITAVTTAAGAIAERYAYTAYGLPTILNASSVTLPTSNFSIRSSYTGREWDATLALHHFRARWMSPIAGRFLGRDPIGYEGSPFNLYEYVRTCPHKYMDPMGEDRYRLGGARPFDHSAICVDLYDEHGTKTCMQYCCELGGVGGSGCSRRATIKPENVCDTISLVFSTCGLWFHPAQILCSERNLTEKEKRKQQANSGRSENEILLRKLKSDDGRSTYFNALFSNCHEYATANL